MGKLPKTDALRAAEAMQKKFGKAFKREDVAIVMTAGGYAKVRNVCPTGIDVIDQHVVGIGGLPYGRIVELKGEESAGKTTILSMFMAAAQRDECLVYLQDSENKFNPEWAAVHGLDASQVVQMQAATLEEFHEQALFAVDRPGPVPFVGLDSIAQIPTELELQEGKDVPAEHARLWAKFLRPFSQKVARRGALVVFVNQIRMKIGVMYGNPETTFGGKALQYAYTIRLRVSHGKGIKDGNVSVARYMHVSAEKNQVAAPHRHATLKLDYATGFDDDWATLEHAKDVGCIEKEASHIPKNVREARANLGWPEKPEPGKKVA